MHRNHFTALLLAVMGFSIGMGRTAAGPTNSFAPPARAEQVPVVLEPEIWRDETQPNAARVADLVRRLSLTEKTRQMRNHAPAIPRLGIPAYDFWNECPNGIARAGNATVFPQPIGLAAMWDEPLMQEIGDTIATEARAKYNYYTAAHNGNSKRFRGLTFWTPNLNLFRDPRWGRGQETFGEDPFLTARLGVRFIQGLQGYDPKYLKAMAGAKHLAVRSGPELQRHRFNATPPERDLYESYLPQFEAAVREGRVGAVMGAANAVAGTPACASPFLLTQLLRQEWGFTGHVVSDFGAIHDISVNHQFVNTATAAAAAAVRAGTDLCCGADYNVLPQAVAAGLIAESEIDIAVTRVLKARFDLGLFDPPSQVAFAQIPITENNTPAHEQLALKAAHEAIVLLKNDGLLPLDRTRLKRIVVVGPNAVSLPVLLGNSLTAATRPVTILAGIQQVVGPNAEVIFEPGCPPVLKPNAAADTNVIAQAVAAARTADVVIYVGGLSPEFEGAELSVRYEGFSSGDRAQIELPAQQTELLRQLHATRKPVVFVNCSGGAVAMPWAAQNLPAILQAWYPGAQGGRAVADILFGAVNPSGRLPVTFYQATTNLPAFENYAMSHRTYRYFSGPPQFSFGHGLSYTRFAYIKARTEYAKYQTGDTVRISVSVKNVGTRAGDEVVQLYYRHLNSVVPQPKLALCAFKRVSLAAGESSRVALAIPVERFRYWDTARKQYVIEPGDYELLVGAGADDIRHRVPFKIMAAK